MRINHVERCFRHDLPVDHLDSHVDDAWAETDIAEHVAVAIEVLGVPCNTGGVVGGSQAISNLDVSYDHKFGAVALAPNGPRYPRLGVKGCSPTFFHHLGRPLEQAFRTPDFRERLTTGAHEDGRRPVPRRDARQSSSTIGGDHHCVHVLTCVEGVPPCERLLKNQCSAFAASGTGSAAAVVARIVAGAAEQPVASRTTLQLVGTPLAVHAVAAQLAIQLVVTGAP